MAEGPRPANHFVGCFSGNRPAHSSGHLVTPPEHPLAGKIRIPFVRLKKETFLMREEGSGIRLAMERFFAEREIHPKTGMEVSSNEAIKQSVQAGLRLLSRATIEQELELKRLVVLDVAEFPIMRH
jgi:DNA-binding transcriptional LysR family regulator